MLINIIYNIYIYNTIKTELLNISKVPVIFSTLSIDGNIIQPSNL